ncbi:MAG: bifunctional methylenetetrahydrofolate dehydrogenase/methenyltetrahydrofolate cyclohydrolase FolD [Bdellovibrionales bacterium]|nr:bifunctional methylenetetrahydrofolate dehydrogenase/methenyltetrahydrofolate cyclohydrolase FolD [Bdellovibrionales bacterium]
MVEVSRPLAPKILNGKWLSKQFEHRLRLRVEHEQKRSGVVPGLAVLLVGEDPASGYYVRTKSKVAHRCGFTTFDEQLPGSASFEDVASVLMGFNEDEKVHGILLQLPLPKHLPEHKLLDLIEPQKDADGLHPLNQGLLARGDAIVKPCTPLGCMHLIDLAYSDIEPGVGEIPVEGLPKADLSGKRAVVIGRSILVGKPVVQLLLERNATVTTVHSRTTQIEEISRDADILIAATGRPHLVGSDWVKDGAIVIDVGINRLEDGSLTGDVDYGAVVGKCHAITPVPGGVGPMTVAMLMENTFSSFVRSMNCD